MAGAGAAPAVRDTAGATLGVAAPAPAEPDFAATDPGDDPRAVLEARAAAETPPAAAHADPRGALLGRALDALRNLWNRP